MQHLKGSGCHTQQDSTTVASAATTPRTSFRLGTREEAEELAPRPDEQERCRVTSTVRPLECREEFIRVKLISIEPTPNPNSMKLNLGESLAKGMSRTYTNEDGGDCPDYIARLLNVPGVKSLFHMDDFIAIQRAPRTDWQGILAGARQAFEGEGELTEDVDGVEEEPDDAFGEVRVELQEFRGIPMLVNTSSSSRT